MGNIFTRNSEVVSDIQEIKNDMKQIENDIKRIENDMEPIKNIIEVKMQKSITRRGKSDDNEFRFEIPRSKPLVRFDGNKKNKRRKGKIH